MLCVVGLYGLTASLVGQRAREMAVRSAIGAAPRDLLRLLPAYLGCIRKLGAGGDGRQRVGLIVALDLRVPVEAGGRQPGGNRLLRMARPDLGDVGGLPVHVSDGLGHQCEVERRSAGTAGIEQRPFNQPPLAVTRCAPVGQIAAPTELADVVLPVTQRTCVFAIDLDPVEQPACARVVQPLVERAAEAAVAVAVFEVAKREHAVAQARQ